LLRLRLLSAFGTGLVCKLCAVAEDTAVDATATAKGITRKKRLKSAMIMPPSDFI